MTDAKGFKDLGPDLDPLSTSNRLEEAKRDPVSYRFDILYPQFIRAMARIAAYGAEKYGDFNWHKSRLIGEKGPINHLINHLTMYQDGKDYDHLEIGSEKRIHLAAIAFNAMMEYWYEENK